MKRSIKTSKLGNVEEGQMLQANSAGTVRLRLIVRIGDKGVIFPSPITGDYHDSCDLIWKIAFAFVGKNLGTTLSFTASLK